MIKVFFLAGILCGMTFAGSSQSPANQPQKKYDLRMQRLRLKIVSSFLWGIYQGQVSIDSAAALAAEVEEMDYSLFYDETYNDGSPLPGAGLIRSGQIAAADILLRQLRDSTASNYCCNWAAIIFLSRGRKRKTWIARRCSYWKRGR
jgi:hypothetical protein